MSRPNTTLIINLIQDIATPHNNILIREFARQNDVVLKLWYALEQDQSQYQWSENITHEHFPAQIYGNTLNWKFIWYCLSHPAERFILVGWMNSNTKLLLLLFFLFRRSYTHWTDLPNDRRGVILKQRFVRRLAYSILRYSRAMVFGVGKPTLDYFESIGFPRQRVVNLPIFIESDEDINLYKLRQQEIFSEYGIQEGDFVLSAGSRLIFEKGYDLLIKAVSQLNEAVRRRVKVLIVGSGVCSDELQNQISTLNLQGQVTLVKWLAIEDFKALIACSDVFIHPARIDSYGGTTLGMALGVPVIGSNGAGAAIDRIEHGKNGFLYEPEDTRQLAHYIELFYLDPLLRKQMAQAALKTAKKWPPSLGLQIIVGNTL